ncbi:hypothetical protein BJ138DRAFT_1146895 [Hygrophoropsis aurantiaca]|uniref:Uncharacterized protein n=1 Tax=Hygrophoropsis aurantiaca TaxID=72124 RepID=A0ACB8AHP1_9AGAM|nr:hypothetical protein BJ138DRAFT_1146895 [Hygrophoropsis aurantiaca]
MAMLQTSYYPLPIAANGLFPPRSPPPFGLRSGYSPRSTGLDRHDMMSTTSTLTVIHAASEAEQGPSLTRHADLWFTDGSIVLKSEQTLFRVHKSQLSRHSAFFRDLFSLPQPAEDRPTSPPPSRAPLLEYDSTSEIEGCSVLRLHDTPQDVQNLLIALYDGPNFGNNYGPADFQIVSGILRLASKYLVDSLRAKALAHLEIAWPSTLKGWDAREDVARADELQTGPSAASIYPSPIAVINLAREVNAPCLLPSAFYDLSRYHYSQIFDQVDDSDNPVSSLPLSVLDMQRLVLGKEAAQHAITTLIQSMGSHAHPMHGQSHGLHPHPHRTCKKDFSELVALATQHYLFDRERGCTDPLYVAEELGQPLYELGQPLAIEDHGRLGETRRGSELSECEACARALEMWATRERERMWKMIPLWFRIEL